MTTYGVASSVFSPDCTLETAIELLKETGFDRVELSAEPGHLEDWPSDPARLADAIVRTLRETDATARRVDRAWRDAQRFSLNHWVAQTETIFEQSLADRASQIDTYLSTRGLVTARSLRRRLACFDLTFRTRRLWSMIRP